MNRENLKRLPLNGTFELTARCNLKCKMCLVRIDHERMIELGGKEKTAEEWIHIAREVNEAGTIGLLLTGGEPMLRPDFIKIYREIALMGFMLTLYTNATLITSEIMEVLKEYPPHEIGITVYGASPKTYEKVTGNANAYYKMLEGVEQLRQLPSEISIRTTIIKDNLEELDQITDWAKSFQPDINFSISRIVTKPIRGSISDVDACRLTPEQSVAMMEQRKMDYFIKPLTKFMQEHPPVIKEAKNEKRKNFGENKQAAVVSKEQNLHEKEATLYGCDAGVISYTITWDGKLVGCQLLGDCWTYPFEDGFSKAWEEFPQKVNLPPVPKQCAGCEVACNACPATRLAETGSMGGFPEYICKESILASKVNNRLLNELKQII